ncbi:MAG: hypothetical protein M3Q75_01750, partial [Gemmatimonadota bacterium]|nr:hypothetical protein [Gemmatimonadota bacterium]
MPPLTLRHLTCGLALLALACGGSERPRAGNDSVSAGATGSTTLTGAGATFPNPIYTKWFDAYAQETG